jgi:predicted enzyme related to lactoylglutathione lyase
VATRMIVYAYTEEFAALCRFYEEALGVEGEALGPSWCAFSTGPGRFALHRQDSADPQRIETFRLDFVVDELEDAMARCAAAGARVTRGVQDEAYGRSAILHDPEGREFTLIEEDPLRSSVVRQELEAGRDRAARVTAARQEGVKGSGPLSLLSSTAFSATARAASSIVA